VENVSPLYDMLILKSGLQVPPKTTPHNIVDHDEKGDTTVYSEIPELSG
jgi:hypothetical protein